MTRHESEQDQGRGPVGDQHEDGIVIEPGAELDRDLEQQGLAPEQTEDEQETA